MGVFCVGGASLGGGAVHTEKTTPNFLSYPSSNPKTRKASRGEARPFLHYAKWREAPRGVCKMGKVRPTINSARSGQVNPSQRADCPDRESVTTTANK